MEPRGEPGVPAQWTHEAAHEGKAHLEHPRTSSYVQIATGRRVRTEHVYDHLHVVATTGRPRLHELGDGSINCCGYS